MDLEYTEKGHWGDLQWPLGDIAVSGEGTEGGRREGGR